MRVPKRYLVTAALPYANGPLHIGHLAGCYIPADIYVRFQRLMGKDILYICGSDEHGAAITLRAQKENKTPQEVIDEYHRSFRDTFQKMHISFDHYHRTSAQIHHETAQEFFTKLYDQGEFLEKTTEQYYDEEAGQFLADRYIKGTCPKCHHDEAYGDQCEHCGSTLSPTELIHPKSTLSGSNPILKTTTHWYLPLDKYEDWLREWIDKGTMDGQFHHYPDEWKKHVLGQCKSWIDGGLQPRAMTRDLDWGVDVPHEIKGHEGKKLYVWMDAPIGYISSTKQWAKDNKKEWAPYWQDEDTAILHFIGKDNIVFHAIIFPAILKAHGDYQLPVNVPANQFMNLEGQKISTSKNWAVWVRDYVQDMPDRVDEMRYFLTKNMPEQKDSEFKWSGFLEANNNELVNNLANFINRVIVLINKYYEGVVPEFDEDQNIIGAGGADMPSFHESELLDLFDRLQALSQHIRAFEFRAALKDLMEISAAGNQILQFNEPWKKQKENPEQVKAVMNLGLQYTVALSVVLKPFLPGTSDKLRQMLQLPMIEEKGELLTLLNDLAEGVHLIKPGHKIGEAKHLFTRFDDQFIQTELDKLRARAASVKEQTHTPIKENIAFEDFTKLDIRTGTIVSAEKVAKTKKLLQLKIDIGFETRNVVSGIAEQFAPEEIIGKKVAMVLNLEPRKIRGVLSEGMVLMAEDTEGKLDFVSPGNGMENGMIVR